MMITDGGGDGIAGKDYPMSLIAAEERSYSIAEAAATGIVERGKPWPCPECRGAGMVPTKGKLIEKPERYPFACRSGDGFVPVDYGVTFCLVCGGLGERR
jgi:hypothetical protein